MTTVLKSYLPRRSDAREFALRNRVLLVQSESGIGIDISLGAIPFEIEMINRAVDVEFESNLTPLAALKEEPEILEQLHRLRRAN